MAWQSPAGPTGPRRYPGPPADPPKRTYPTWMIALASFVALVLLALLGDLLARGISAADIPTAGSASPIPPPTVYVPPPPEPTETASPTPVSLPTVIAPVSPGATGPTVSAFQQRLAQLTYMVGPVNGVYGSDTGFAVTAFQKVTGLPRTGVIDGATAAALATAQIPTATYLSPPDHIEVDIARQVLLVVSGGQVTATVAVSTGSGETFYEKNSPGKHHAITPNGMFSVLWKYSGWWTSPLGHMYKPAFIDDTLGIAIHGYSSVPPQPASHGCIRVPLAFADTMAKLDPVGTTVYVFGGPVGDNPPGAV